MMKLPKSATQYAGAYIEEVTDLKAQFPEYFGDIDFTNGGEDVLVFDLSHGVTAIIGAFVFHDEVVVFDEEPTDLVHNIDHVYTIDDPEEMMARVGHTVLYNSVTDDADATDVINGTGREKRLVAAAIYSLSQTNH